MKNKRLYVVIPCYNEEEVLKETTKRLNVKFNELIKNVMSLGIITEDDIAVLAHELHDQSLLSQIPQLVQMLDFKADDAF